MSKNKIIMLLLLFPLNKLAAQTILKIDELAMIRNSVAVEVPGFIHDAGTSLSSTSFVKAKKNTALEMMGVSLDKIQMQPKWQGGEGNVLNLSEYNQDIAWTGISAFNWSRYGFSMLFSVSNIFQSAWLAGDYAIDLEYGSWGFGLFPGTNLVPGTKQLIISVPVIVNDVISSGKNFNLTVDDLKYFRNETLSHSNFNLVRHTVNLGLYASSNKGVFDFSNGYKGVVAPNVGVENAELGLSLLKLPALTDNQISNILNLVSFSNAIYLGSQRLSTTPTPLKDIWVDRGNLSAYFFRVQVSPQNLKKNFINKGTYSNKMTITSSFLGSSSKADAELNIVVNDLAELTVSQNQVNFSFNTVKDYSNGIAIDLPNHLKISKTTPYDVSVRAENANFSSGSDSFPAGILSIGAGSGETLVNNSITISTKDQTLINGGNPTIDKDVSLKYSISAAAAGELIMKKKGTYSNNIIYSLTAH